MTAEGHAPNLPEALPKSKEYDAAWGYSFNGIPSAMIPELGRLPRSLLPKGLIPTNPPGGTNIPEKRCGTHHESRPRHPSPIADHLFRHHHYGQEEYGHSAGPSDDVRPGPKRSAAKHQSEEFNLESRRPAPQSGPGHARPPRKEPLRHMCGVFIGLPLDVAPHGGCLLHCHLPGGQ